MKKIYIVFIASNFKSGTLIRRLTKSRYNHVALSFTPDISELYSFARYNYYEPLLGGYGVEYVNRYLEIDQDIDIKICELEIETNHYQQIIETLNFYETHKEETKYNFLSIITYPFGKSVKINYAFTCIDFILNLLNITKRHSIKGLERKFENQMIYQGKLSKRLGKEALEKTDDFFVTKNKFMVYVKTAAYFVTLCCLIFTD